MQRFRARFLFPPFCTSSFRVHTAVRSHRFRSSWLGLVCLTSTLRVPISRSTKRHTSSISACGHSELYWRRPRCAFSFLGSRRTHRTAGCRAFKLVKATHGDNHGDIVGMPFRELPTRTHVLLSQPRRRGEGRDTRERVTLVLLTNLRHRHTRARAHTPLTHHTCVTYTLRPALLRSKHG